MNGHWVGSFLVGAAAYVELHPFVANAVHLSVDGATFLRQSLLLAPSDSHCSKCSSTFFIWITLEPFSPIWIRIITNIRYGWMYTLFLIYNWGFTGSLSRKIFLPNIAINFLNSQNNRNILFTDRFKGQPI